jgi:uncharacterized membrane protein (UPF0127 family)
MIKNKSKNTIVSKTFVYKTGLTKVKGLLFEKKAKALIFRTRFGIHTFFMRFPIDLMVIDKNKNVVFIKESVKPNRIIFWNPRFDLVIELPKGSIKNSNTKPGDTLDFHL